MDKNILQLSIFSFLDSDKYPMISEKIKSIHHMPTKVLITAYEESNGRHLVSLEHDLYESSLLYNSFLSKCNGKNSIKQIIEDFREAGIDTEELLPILENAIFKGWIVLGDGPLPSDISAEKNGLKPTGDSLFFYPKHLSIELTDVCNLFCKHCYRDASAEGKYIPKDALFKLIDNLAPKGLEAIELTGGEPLLHPDFLEIVKYAADRLELVAILTNGMLVDETIIEQLKPYSDKVIVGVSVDSSTSAFHDSFRGAVGSWDKATKAVSLLSRNGFFTRVAMSIAPSNINDLEGVLALSIQLGAQSFTYNLIMPFGRGAEISWGVVTKEELLKYAISEKKIKKNYPRQLSTLPERTLKLLFSGESNCGGGWRTAVISPSGNMRPCVNIPEGFLDVGNVFEEGIDLYKKPIFTIFSHTKVPRPSVCKDCKFIDFCVPCWYRGLVGSAQVPDCKWDCELKPYVSSESIKKVKDGCITSKMTLFG